MLPLIKTVSADSAFKAPDAVDQTAITNETTPKAFTVVIFISRSAIVEGRADRLTYRENFLFPDFTSRPLIRIEIRIAGLSKRKEDGITSHRDIRALVISQSSRCRFRMIYTSRSLGWIVAIATVLSMWPRIRISQIRTRAWHVIHKCRKRIRNSNRSGRVGKADS